MKLRQRNWQLKYFAEWVISFVGIIVILPLLILIVVLQQIFDNGPIFYCSDRIGKNGKIFRLYKFRSMKVDSKEIKSLDNKLITIKNDSRITPFGRLLRLGFDELPQLFNILKGEMCLIGPRPDIPEELSKYNSRERLRVNVLPGITGLTQVVNGRELTNKENYELDVRYVSLSNFETDFQIVLFTLPYSLGKKNIGIRYLKRYLYEIDYKR